MLFSINRFAIPLLRALQQPKKGIIPFDDSSGVCVVWSLRNVPTGQRCVFVDYHGANNNHKREHRAFQSIDRRGESFGRIDNYYSCHLAGLEREEEPVLAYIVEQSGPRIRLDWKRRHVGLGSCTQTLSGFVPCPLGHWQSLESGTWNGPRFDECPSLLVDGRVNVPIYY